MDHGAATGGRDHVHPLRQLGHDLALETTEACLAVVREDAFHGLAGPLHDQLVGVGEVPAEQLCDAAAHGALAGAGEADEKYA